MLSDEKILVTGAGGQIGLPLAASLAADNEVWGVARFSQSGTRDRLESHYVHAHPCDLAAGDYSTLPTDFTYVVHFAVFQGGRPRLRHGHPHERRGHRPLVAARTTGQGGTGHVHPIGVQAARRCRPCLSRE